MCSIICVAACLTPTTTMPTVAKLRRTSSRLSAPTCCEKLVAAGFQALGVGDGLAPALVEGAEITKQRHGVRPARAQLLFHNFEVAADKSQVEHRTSSLTDGRGAASGLLSGPLADHSHTLAQMRGVDREVHATARREASVTCFLRPSSCGRGCGTGWLRPGGRRSGARRLRGRQWCGRP